MRSRQGEHSEEVVNLSTSTPPLDDMGFYKRNLKKKRQYRFAPRILKNHCGSPGVVQISRGCMLILQVCNTWYRTTKQASSFPGVQIVLFFVIAVCALLCVYTDADTKQESKSGQEPVSVCTADKTLPPPCTVPAIGSVLMTKSRSHAATDLPNYQITWKHVTSASDTFPAITTFSSSLCLTTLLKNSVKELV